MALKRPSEYFKQDIISIDNSVQDLIKSPDLGTFSDAFETFRNNLTKLEVVSSQVEEIQNEIQDLLRKEDLDNAMMSQLLVLEQSIRDVQSKVNKVNEKNLKEIRIDVSGLTESVNEFLEVEVPIYKKLITDYELRASNRFDQLEENVNQTLGDINEFVETNYNVIGQKINDVSKLSKQVKLTEKSIEDHKGIIEKKVSDLEANIVRNETHIRVQNKNFQAIKEEVKDTLSKINLEEIEKHHHKLKEKVKYIEEVFEKFNEKEILTETILVAPPSTNNKDPLTPLDQKFVTLDQLQDHYRLFINRIQQQLASIGGGGETRLEFLDDVDRNTVKQDGYVLQYSSAQGKFIGTSYVPGGGGNVAIAITNIAPSNPDEGNLWYDRDIGRTFLYYTDDDGSQWVDANPSGSIPDSTYWVSTNAGIHTTSNVGIGTTNPTSKLDVQSGDIRVGVNTSNGVILTSPNGTKYRLIVDNAGSLSTVLVP